MGGNQSKTIQRTNFTSTRAFSVVSQNSTDLKLNIEQTTTNNTNTLIDGITIKNVDNSTVKVSAIAESKFISINDINLALGVISNADLTAAEQLDAITGMMNSMKQESLGIANSQTTEISSNDTFKLSTAVENINKMVTSICFCSKATVNSNASVLNTLIENITGGSKITVEAISKAETSLETLVKIMDSKNNATDLITQMKNTDYNDFGNNQEQTSKAVEDLTKTVAEISEDVRGIAEKGIDTAGDVATEGFGALKWTIIGPIIAIIALIGLIIIVKLFGNSNKKQMEMMQQMMVDMNRSNQNNSQYNSQYDQIPATDLQQNQQHLNDEYDQYLE